MKRCIRAFLVMMAVGAGGVARAEDTPGDVVATVYGQKLMRADIRRDLQGGGEQLNPRAVDAFWDYAIVTQAMAVSGVPIKPERIAAFKDEMAAHISGEKPGSPEKASEVIAAWYKGRGITNEREIAWRFGTAAGMRMLAENAEKIEPGTTQLSAEEQKEILKTGAESLDVIDFYCTAKVDADISIKKLIAMEKIESMKKKQPCETLRVYKVDTDISSNVQMELWKNLQGMKDQFSTVALLDRQAWLWHVYYVRSHNDAKPENGAADVLALNARKAEAWQAQHLKALRIASLPCVVFNMGAIKNCFDEKTGAMGKPAPMLNINANGVLYFDYKE